MIGECHETFQSTVNCSLKCFLVAMMKKTYNSLPFTWKQFFVNYKTAPFWIRAFLLFYLFVFLTILPYLAFPEIGKLLYYKIGGAYPLSFFFAFMAFWVIYNNGRNPIWFYWVIIIIFSIHLGVEAIIEYRNYRDQEIFFWKYDLRYWRYAWNFAIPIFWLGILLTKNVRTYIKGVNQNSV